MLSSQALALLLAVALIHSVWRGSGARILLVAEVASVAVLLTDLGWSFVATRRLSIRVVDVPADATVGDGVGAEIVVAGTRAAVDVRMLTGIDTAWHRVEGPEQGTLLATAPARMVATVAVFEVRCTEPLGLLGVSRRLVVDLPHNIAIGPRPEPIEGARFPDRGALPAIDEVVRGTREWKPGDALRSVHWPSVARTSTLMVRELEPPPAPKIVIVLSLGEGGPAAEAAASRAAWLAREALRRSLGVDLVTVEDGRTRAAAVRGPLDLGRRLAAATRGEPAHTEHVDDWVVHIGADGDRFP